MGLFSKARSTLREKAREAEVKEMERKRKARARKQALKEATSDASTILKASRPGRAARAGVKASEKTVDVGEKAVSGAARGLEKFEEKGGESGFRVPDPSEFDEGIDPLSSEGGKGMVQSGEKDEKSGGGRAVDIVQRSGKWIVESDKGRTLSRHRKKQRAIEAANKRVASSGVFDTSRIKGGEKPRDQSKQSKGFLDDIDPMPSGKKKREGKITDDLDIDMSDF